MIHIDSDVAWREMVKSICEIHGSITYLGFPGAKEGLDACVKRDPDIVAADAECIDYEGNALLHELFGWPTEKALLILTSRCDDVLLHWARHPRCYGLIWKTPKYKVQILEALDALLQKKKYFPTEVMDLIQSRHAKPDFYGKLLSDSELNILPLFGHGLSNEEVSLLTGLSLSTVKWHKTKLFEKLGLENNIQLTNWAKEMGFVVWMRPAPPCIYDGPFSDTIASDPSEPEG